MNPVNNAPGGAGSVQQIIQLREQLLERNRLLQDLQQTQAAQPVDAVKQEPGDFTNMVENALSSVNAAQGRAAEISEAYERGEVHDVAKVMLARQEAGVAFEATLQVRNRLLSAYQEIMRMGV